MKFIKSSLAQKLIIILIALMIFNIAVPQQVHAADLMGILMKPLYMAVLGIVVSVDVTLGVFLCGISSSTKAVGSLVDLIIDEKNGKQFMQSQSDVINMIFIGPDTIFSGQVDMLNANIFDYVEDVETPDYNAENILDSLTTGSMSLARGQSKRALYAKTVSRLYIILRNTCALVMLAGLIYTGIRILLSANVPTKKGQYLTILQDWLVGLVLLVFSHLIMILVFKMSDALTKALGLSLNGMGGLMINLVTDCVSSFDSAEQLISLLMLIYMVWLTIIFALSYMKRFFWVCLLIILAPVFSTLYAFGQQTKSMYSRWLKEYMTVVLVQPYHMLVYSVLVAIPMGMTDSGFSVHNISAKIYALGAMTMIRPAEKYLRSLFGMDQGIASVASYESGKQTFDAIKKVVASVAKVVIAAAATVATSGAAAPLLAKVAAGGAIKGIAAKGIGKMALNAAGKGGGGKGLQMLGDVASNIGNNMPSKDSGAQTDVAGPKKEIAGLLPAGKNTEPAPKPEADNKTDEEEKEQPKDEFEIRERKKRKGLLSFGAGVASDAYGAFMGNKSFIDIGGKYLKDHPFMRVYGAKDRRIEKMCKSKDPEVRAKGEKMKAERAESKEFKNDLKNAALGFGKAFEAEGGFKELYKGFNEIRDTMFIGDAPKDWQGTAKQMDEKYKEKEDKKKYDFVHNEQNKQNIIAKMDLEAKAKNKYPNEADAAKRTDWIDSKAEEELQKIADKYIPLGVTDFDQAYGIRQIEKQKGCTPLQAFQAYGKQANNDKAYELFVKNEHVIEQANHAADTKGDPVDVEVLIPDAKEMWDNGYRDINDMSNVKMIMDKLNTSLDKAMSMEQALRNKGSINYTGKNEDVAKIVKDLNENFGKNRK